MVDTSNNLGQLSGIGEFDYYNVRLLWKAGIGNTVASTTSQMLTIGLGVSWFFSLD